GLLQSQTYYLAGSSRAGDLLPGPLSEIMSGNVQHTIDPAIAEDSQAVLFEFANNSRSQKFLRTNFRPLVEFHEIANVNGRELLLEGRIGESALGQSPVQRHLPAFETALLTASRTRPHTFVPAPRRLAVSGARTTPNPFSLVRRSRIRPECVYTCHKYFSSISNLQFWNLQSPII